MQVLGQYVETGDVINFPINRHKGQYRLAPVARIVGMRAFDDAGNTCELPYDDHVMVVTP